MDDISASLTRLEQDPGDPVFADVCESLRQDGQFSKALEIGLAGVSANPACHLGRLALARVFYDKGWTALAVREVRELRDALPEVGTLQKLLASLSPDSSTTEQSYASQAPGEDMTVAETDFNLDDIDLIDESSN